MAPAGSIAHVDSTKDSLYKLTAMRNLRTVGKEDSVTVMGKRLFRIDKDRANYFNQRNTAVLKPLFVLPWLFIGSLKQCAKGKQERERRKRVNESLM